jgi:hypothetical protein
VCAVPVCGLPSLAYEQPEQVRERDEAFETLTQTQTQTPCGGWHTDRDRQTHHSGGHSHPRTPQTLSGHGHRHRHRVGTGTDTDTEWWSAQHSDGQQRGRVASAGAQRLIVHASLPAVSAYPFEIAPCGPVCVCVCV